MAQSGVGAAAAGGPTPHRRSRVRQPRPPRHRTLGRRRPTAAATWCRSIDRRAVTTTTSPLVVRHRRGGEGRGRLFVDARNASPPPSSPPRALNSGTESTTARATAPTLSTRGSTEPSGPRRLTIGATGSTHIDAPSSRLVERDFAAHDVMGPGPFGGAPADSLDLRGAVRIFGRSVPEVVVVEVVAHQWCRRRSPGATGHRSSTGRHQIATLEKKWQCSTSERHRGGT